MLGGSWRRVVANSDAQDVAPLQRTHNAHNTFPPHARGEALEIAAAHGLGDVMDVLFDEEAPGHDDDVATRRRALATSLLQLAGFHGHRDVMWRLFKRLMHKPLRSSDTANHGETNAAFVTLVSLHEAHEEAALRMACEQMLAAARRGDLATVQALVQEDTALAQGMDDATGETAFAAAFAYGHRNICELLLECGAFATGVCVDLTDAVSTVTCLTTSKDTSWRTSSLVLRAVQDRNAPLVAWLLELGASAYTPVVDGARSPLSLAAYHGLTEIVVILLDHGARLDETQCRWMPLPERWAMDAWKLTDRLKITLSDPTSFLLLAIACYTQNRHFANFLWTTRTDLQDRALLQQFGTLALALAIHRRDDDMVHELVMRGASTATQLIRLAIVEADAAPLLRLFSSGSSGSSSRITQQLLFVKAAKLGSIECVKEMMTTDAVRAQDATRNIAACGIQAFEYANKNGDVEMATLLIEQFYVPLSGTSISRCFGHAIEQQHLELLELLLAHPAATASVVQTALMEACLRGLHHAVALLLAYGVDVNASICHGTTYLLHQVVSKLGQGDGFSLSAKLLLDAGASTELFDSFGETPWAAIQRRRSYIRTSTGMAQLEYVESILQDRAAASSPGAFRTDRICL